MTEPSNRQGGIGIGDGITDSDGRVATGDRRDVRLERDPDQIVKAVHLEKPEGPLAPQQQTANADDVASTAGVPVQDVAVARDGPSVWDARPQDPDAPRGRQDGDV